MGPLRSHAALTVTKKSEIWGQASCSSKQLALSPTKASSSARRAHILPRHALYIYTVLLCLVASLLYESRKAPCPSCTAVSSLLRITSFVE